MTSPRSRRLLLVAAGSLAVCALVAATLFGGDPSHIWIRCDPGARTGDFFLEPDGEAVQHGATMQDDAGAWAYYYPLPTPGRDLLWRIGLGGTGTVDFLATGRETVTASGRWREFRRCSSPELMAVIHPRSASARTAR